MTVALVQAIGLVFCLLAAIWAGALCHRAGLHSRLFVNLVVAVWCCAAIWFGAGSAWAGISTVALNIAILAAAYLATVGHEKSRNMRFAGFLLAVGTVLALVQLPMVVEGSASAIVKAAFWCVVLALLAPGATGRRDRAGGAGPIILLSAFAGYQLAADIVPLIARTAAPYVDAANGYIALLVVGASVPRTRDMQLSRRLFVRGVSFCLVFVYFLAIAVFWSLSDPSGDLPLRLSQIVIGLFGMALAVLWIGSQQTGGWLKVVLAKHVFQHRYDYREEWLRFSHSLSQHGDTAFETRAIHALAAITQSPAGVLLCFDEDDALRPVGRYGRTSLDDAAPAWLRRRERPSADHVIDLTQTADSPLNGAWVAVPLVHRSELLGFAVLDPPPDGRSPDWEDFDLLKAAGRQLASYLAEQSGQRALAEARKFDEFNRRMAFVVHDIKNLSSQLQLCVDNAERHIENPAFRADMMLTLRASSGRLNGLLQRLGRYGEPGDAVVEPFDAANLLREVADDHGQATIRGGIPGSLFLMGQPAALRQALVHIVSNASEADPTGQVVLDLRSDGLRGTLVIEDSGPGMSSTFVRDELFKPFVSTKNGGFGIGAHEARTLVRGMGGRLSVDSREGVGTRFLISLPLARTRERHDAAIRFRSEVA